jgi:hypothetical protein
MKRSRVTAVFVGVAMVACGRYFRPDRNLGETLSEEMIIGRWHLSRSTLQLLVRDGFETSPEHRYTLDLLPGGSCVFESVSFGQYVSAPCAWSLEHDTTGDSNIEKKNALRLEIHAAQGMRGHYLNFARVDGELVMWNYHGDPDSWEFMEYERGHDATSHQNVAPSATTTIGSPSSGLNQ